MLDRVAVIGGGYTGLVASIELSEKGYKVDLFERSPILGGLASGFTVEGYPLEKAYHHIFKTDTHIIEYAHKLGVDSNLKWYPSKTGLVFKRKLYPFAGAMDLLRFTPLTFVNRIRVGVNTLWLQFTKNWGKYVNTSAYDWVRKFMGKQATEVIWEPLLRGKFHSYYREVSMAWLWARLHTRGNSTGDHDKQEYLGWFDGGFQSFTDALVAKAEQVGVSLHVGTEIVSVNPQLNEEGEQEHLNLVFPDGKVENYGNVLFTTPSHIVSKMFPGLRPVLKDKMDYVNYLGARLLIFSSTQQLSPYYWHNINDRDLSFLVFINHTNLVGTEKYNGRNIYYMATYLPEDHELFMMSDEVLEQKWFSELREVFPQFNENMVHEKHHFRFRNAQHVVTNDYLETSLPPYVIGENVYLANFTQIYPEDRGTNFAVREGVKIAELIHRSFTDEY